MVGGGWRRSSARIGALIAHRAASRHRNRSASASAHGGGGKLGARRRRSSASCRHRSAAALCWRKWHPAKSSAMALVAHQLSYPAARNVVAAA